MIGVGVVGIGYWGPNLIRVFNETGRSQVVAACDRRPDRHESVRRRYPTTIVTTSYDEMLANPAVQAVVVATPVGSHYAMAVQALEAGKHVIVEKPLATKGDEVQDLYRRAAALGLVIMGAYTFLYSGPVLKVREILDRQELGRLYYIDSSRVNLGLYQFDVGVTWDLGPHDVSMILYWLGQSPAWVQATGHAYVRPPREDMAYILMGFAEDVIAHLHVSWLAPSKLRRTTLIGDRRMVLYDDLEPVEKVKVFDHGVNTPSDVQSELEYKLSYRFGDIHAPHVDTTEPLLAQSHDFLDAIEKGRAPRCSPELVMGVTRVLEAVEKSLQQGGRQVSLKGDGTP